MWAIRTMRGLVFLFLGAGSHCRHNKGRRIAVSYIVLQNHHRSGAALFGADVRLHVCIVNVPSEVFPVFWYDSDQTSYPSICSKSRPFMAGGSCRKSYADKGESINVLQEGSENGWSHCRSQNLLHVAVGGVARVLPCIFGDGFRMHRRKPCNQTLPAVLIPVHCHKAGNAMEDARQERIGIAHHASTMIFRAS